jgi:hypothetical protein
MKKHFFVSNQVNIYGILKEDLLPTRCQGWARVLFSNMERERSLDIPDLVMGVKA